MQQARAISLAPCSRVQAPAEGGCWASSQGGSPPPHLRLLKLLADGRWVGNRIGGQQPSIPTWRKGGHGTELRSFSGTHVTCVAAYAARYIVAAASRWAATGHMPPLCRTMWDELPAVVIDKAAAFDLDETLRSRANTRAGRGVGARKALPSAAAASWARIVCFNGRGLGREVQARRA